MPLPSPFYLADEVFRAGQAHPRLMRVSALLHTAEDPADLKVIQEATDFGIFGAVAALGSYGVIFYAGRRYSPNFFRPRPLVLGLAAAAPVLSVFYGASLLRGVALSDRLAGSDSELGKQVREVWLGKGVPPHSRSWGRAKDE